MESSPIQVRPIDFELEGQSAYELLRELRGGLAFEDFAAIYREASKSDDYRFWGAYRGHELLGLMGARVLHDFVHGKHFYVDDLVIGKEFRSQGIGQTLLAFAETQAREWGCRGLRLCTGFENEGARRFYEREGWAPRAIAFKKKL